METKVSDAADYRKEAEAAERQAVAAPSSLLRETFLRLAQAWRDLAEQADAAARDDRPR
jgi:hypothetical protein